NWSTLTCDPYSIRFTSFVPTPARLAPASVSKGSERPGLRGLLLPSRRPVESAAKRPVRDIVSETPTDTPRPCRRLPQRRELRLRRAESAAHVSNLGPFCPTTGTTGRGGNRPVI